MLYSLSSALFTLALFLCAWVLGLAVLGRLGVASGVATLTTHLLALPVGLGCSALLLFLLAATGALQVLPVTVVFSAAVLLVLRAARQAAPLPLGEWWLHRNGYGLTCVALLASAGFLLAMNAPLEWDELAYHLPYARDYVLTGGLTVSEHLRFPLQPHNYHLLYAAGLLFSSEASTHLVHALSGALVAVGIFVYARQQFDLLTGLIAAGMFLATAGSLIDAAYVDLGVAMFIFYAFYSFALWQRDGRPALLLVAAFLLAMAAGTKYQALVMLPAFAAALLLANCRAALAVRAFGVLCLFGTYWYLRSWWLSGDPLHPLGAPLFGYWLWNQGDLAGQHADLEQRAGHLPWELLPALLAPLLPNRRQPEQRTLLVLALVGVAGWYLTSRYDRYLLPVYPFLALLAAQVIRQAIARLPWLHPRALRTRRMAVVVRLAALALVAAVLARTVAHDWDQICFTTACVERVHATRLLSAEARRSVPDFDRLRLYQFGLEQEIYALGPQVVGDWFGPYRYRDLLDLEGDAEAIRRHLAERQLDSLLINRRREPFAALWAHGSLTPEFDTVYLDSNVVLLKIAE